MQAQQPRWIDNQKYAAPLEQENRKLVLRMYDEFDKGTLKAFQPSISPQFVANVMGNQSMDWKGFVEFSSLFLSAFPDGHHTFDHVIVEGNEVVTVGRYRGTHQGELLGISPTYRRIDLAVMHLDRVENGRIVEHRGIGNGLDLMNQLGVSIGN